MRLDVAAWAWAEKVTDGRSRADRLVSALEDELLPSARDRLIFAVVRIKRVAMSVTKIQASALATTKRKAKPTKLLRTRPARKKLSDIALLKKAIKHYPKTLARLAK